MTKEQLKEKMESLVWHAWSLGQSSGRPTTPSRRTDEMHREVWEELNTLLEDVDEL